jgi:ribonuclease Z
MSFQLTILGSGAALPTAFRKPTSQYINCNERHILIDCGEGTQSQIRIAGIKLQKITHILISHLHGDHYFGLVGLLQLEVGHAKLGFSLDFVSLNGKEHRLLFEDKSLEIHTFPLKHKIPTNGFIVKEKPKERSIIGEALRESGVSLMAVPYFRRGEDFISEEGETFYADDFTYAPKPSKSYAFCSDTIYTESIVPFIQGVDVLYHEATFTEKEADRAKATMHSTAKQAATIAQKAGVGRLLLGHLSARFDGVEAHLKEARPVFENVVVVSDFDVVEI